MRKIWISDITMKQPGRSGGYTLSFREKIEISKQLDKLGVSVIEISQIENIKTDSLLIKSLCSAVKDSTIAVPVNVLDPDSVEITWNALKNARHPRLQVSAPVSTVQMEYFCHKKPEAMAKIIEERVKSCSSLCREVEFVAEDAGRSDFDFLISTINTAVQAGASIVTVCDTAGNMMSDEFFESVKKIKNSIPEDVRLGVKCSNDLFMADSCAFAAIRAGADEVKTVSCGETTTSLEKIAKIIAQRGDSFKVTCTVNMSQLQRIIGQIKWLCETERSKSSPFDNGVRNENEDITLTAHDGIEAVMKVVSSMGYDLSEEDSNKVYEAFARIAAKKESVGIKELDAIVASAALQVPPTYRIESYVINTGNIITATAHMRLKKGDEIMESVCVGDGPVDASFLAIEQIAGQHYELDDFQIQAVTEGREAMGEAVVRLRSGGKLYSGRGISTDVIGSAIQAYINALNKIVYEGGEI